MWNGDTDLLEPRAGYALGQLNNDDFWILGKQDKVTGLQCLVTLFSIKIFPYLMQIDATPCV